MTEQYSLPLSMRHMTFGASGWCGGDWAGGGGEGVGGGGGKGLGGQGGAGGGRGGKGGSGAYVHPISCVVWKRMPIGLRSAVREELPSLVRANKYWPLPE